MTTMETAEVGRHAKENPPVEEQTPVVLGAPKHAREDILDPELTSEEEQALAEYVDSGEVETCSKKQGLFDGLYEKIIVKEYATRPGQTQGALHLYGVRMDGEPDDHLSWDDVAEAYGHTVEPVPDPAPPRHRLVSRAQNTPLGELNSVGQEVPTEAIKKRRSDLLNELDVARMKWVREEAVKGRQTLVFSHKERNQLWEEYQSKFAEFLEYEGYRMDEANRFGRNYDDDKYLSAEVIEILKHQEERMLAYRYTQAMYEATGYYELEHRDEPRSGLRDDGVFGGVQVVNKQDQPLTDYERFAQWFGDKSGTRKEQIERSAKKVGIVVLGGLGVGVLAGLTLASAGFLAAPIAAAGGGAFSARVGKSIFLSKLNSKARDMNITTHADDAQMRLLATTEYAADGHGRIMTTRRTWNRKEVAETRSMQELIRNETNRNIEKNIIRFGAMALSAAVAAAAGLEVTKVAVSEIGETVKAHNPFDWDLGRLKFWDNDHGVAGRGSSHEPTTAPTPLHAPTPTPSHEPTPTPSPTPTPAPTPTPPSVGPNHDIPHDGYKPNGEKRIPKHGKLGLSFEAQSGTGQIREIQDYAAAHNYQGIDGAKATQVFEHIRHLGIAHNGELLRLDSKPSASASTYWVGNDPRLVDTGHAEWASRALERTIREELEKESTIAAA